MSLKRKIINDPVYGFITISDDLIFDIPTLVSYISSFMTLLPGDIISTGTPSGVGMGIKPAPIYLKPGDVVELGIDGLGCAQQNVVAAH